MRIFKALFIYLLTLLIVASSIHADTTPMQITLQATLSSQTEGLIEGRHRVKVDLIGKEDTPIYWSEEFSGVLFIRGTCSLILGSDPTKSELSADDFDIDNPKFRLTVTIDDREYTVKIPLASAPYAVQAKIAEEVKEVNAERVTGTFTSTVNIQNDLLVGDNVLYVNATEGKIGINNGTPNFSLDVDGSINATEYKINGEDIETALSWQKRSNNDLYYIDGNVGVGTSSPDYPLEVVGTVNASEYYINGKPLEKYFQNILSWKKSSDELDIYFNDGTSEGKVGIGVTTPQEMLHVEGAIKIGESVQGSSAEAGTIQYSDSDFLGYDGSSWISLTGIQPAGDISSGEITYWTGTKQVSGSDVFKWDAANQYLGVGTENPTARLDIHEMSTDTQDIKLLHVVSNDGESLLVVNSQNVGVGISEPEFKLDINGAINATDFRIGGEPIQNILLSGTYWSLENYDRIFYDLGNVGIGTSQPRNLLEIASVTGNASLTFDLGGVDLFTMGIEEENSDAFVISKGENLSTPVFTFKGEKIGVGLSNPETNLHVSGNSGVVIEGHVNEDLELPASGRGTRMMFFPGKAAFRAGTVEGTEWNSENIGLYSSAVGYGPIASGEGSAVLGGYKNEASGDYAVAAGGYSNTAQGDYSFAAGYKAEALHSGSFVWGDYLPSSNTTFKSTASNQFIVHASNGVGLGTNETDGSALTVKRTDDNDLIFKASGNEDAGDYAFVVNTSGNVGIGTSDPGEANLAVMNGFVGIGTTTPNAPLSIRNTSENSYLIYAEGASITGTSSVFVVTTSGNVGVGTSEPTARLTVMGSIVGTSFQIVDPNDPDATITLQPNPGSPWADPSKSDGNTSRSQGLVGIGTPSPNSLLEISNRSGEEPVITFDIDGTDYFTMGVTQNMYSIQPGSRLIQTYPAIAIGTENVGIGTYEPSTNLHVSGNTILEGKVAIATTNVESIYSMLIDGSIAIEEDLYIQDVKFEPQETPWKTEGLNIYYLSGNVGIGYSNPSTALQVKGTISANAIVVDDNLDIDGDLRADSLFLKDTSSNITEASGNLYIEDGELIYVDPAGALKVVSSPLQKGEGDTGLLAFWTGDASIGESGISWDNNNAKMDVSGNFNLTNTYNVSGGFSVTNNVSFGAPTAIDIEASISHAGILAETQDFTAHAINLDVLQNWGKDSGVVSVKGLDISATQESNSFFLNDANFVGLNVDVSGVTTNTGKVVAALFNGGKVGINTTEPTVDLEVNGTVSANFFNLTGGLSVPELAVGTDKLVAEEDDDGNPRIGIGTTTPQSELDVIGTISANVLEITNSIVATTANIGNGTFFVNENGNIGIGTTEPNENGQLDIFKDITGVLSGDFTAEKVGISINGAGEDQIFFLRRNLTGLDIKINSNSASNVLADNNTVTGVKLDLSGANLQSNATGVGLDIDVTGDGGNRYAAIFNGGNVGVGTTRPEAALHVSGNLIADNLFLEGNIEAERATFNYLLVHEDATLTGSVSINALHVLNNITANTLVLESSLTASTANIDVIEANTASFNTLLKGEGLTVDGTFTGDTATFETALGVGTTTIPASGLVVSGSVTANTIEVTEALTLDSAILNVNSGTLYVGTENTYVGIGTQAPTAPLHIVYSSPSNYSAENNRSWNALRIQTPGSGSGKNAGILLAPYSGAPSSSVGSGIVAVKPSSSDTDFGSDLAFVVDPISGLSSEAMRLTSKGYLGIGTTKPSYQLEVAGNAYITGNIEATSLTVEEITNESGLTITGNGTLIVESAVSANENLKSKNGLYLYKGDVPVANSSYGILYVDENNSDIFYMRPAGTTINLTSAFTGTPNKIPYFDSSSSINDDADIYWLAGDSTLQIGTGNTLTQFEVVSTLNNGTTGIHSAQAINMVVSKRTTGPTSLGDNIFSGLKIDLQSENPNDEYEFGRLAKNEIGIGLNVDVTNLKAKAYDNQFETSSLNGFKYAASFRGGNVGIGTTLPNAALHIASEENGSTAFRVDALDTSGTAVLNALVVTSNGYVGIGTSQPDASLEVKGVNDSVGSAAFHVKNNSGDSLLYVQNNGYVGIGKTNPTTSLDVEGIVSANTGSFGEITATTLNITNASGGTSFFINRDGEVGIGTTLPSSDLSFSKTFSSAESEDYTQQSMTVELAGSGESTVYYFQKNLTGYDLELKSDNTSTDKLTGTATGISVDMSQLEFGSDTKAVGLDINVSSNASVKYAALFLGGNVGIGVTEPTVPLEIAGTLNATNLYISDTFQATNATFNEIVVETSASFNGTVTVNTLYADTISANTIVMTGTFSANQASFNALTAATATFNSLGIGVNSPSASLDVQGGAIFAGGVTINGSLNVDLISGNSGITINTNGAVNIVGVASFNSDVKIENALYMKPSSTPDTDADFGILFSDSGNENALTYKYPDGSTINISSMYTGTEGVIPYYGGTEFKDDAAFTYDATEKRITIGDSDNLSSFELSNDIGASVQSDYYAQKIDLEFTETPANVANTYYGLNIELKGSDPDDPLNFGRLAENETAYGLFVDMTTLKAKQSNVDGVGVGGKKVAAQFIGGSVGIGHSIPEAALHVRNDDTEQPNLPLFLVERKSGDSYVTSMIVSSNGRVGINDDSPSGILSIKGTTDDNSEYSLWVENNAGTALMTVRNDNKVGIGNSQPSANFHVSGSGSGVVPFIVETSEAIRTLVVTSNGFVGLGTDQPSANVHVAKLSDSQIPFIVDADSTYALMVNSAGNVGIGTSSPQSLLHVNGLIESAPTGSLVTISEALTRDSTRGYLTRTSSDFAFFGLQNQESDGSGDFDTIIHWGNNDDTDNDLIFRVSTSNSQTTEVARFTSTGNFGINTSVPEALVHVSKASAEDYIFRVDTSDGTAAMVVSNNGFIGIGTEVPSSSLHVAGTLEASSLLITQGTVAVSTLNVSDHIYVERVVTLNDQLQDNDIYGQKINITISRDIKEDVVGLDIVLESSDRGAPYETGSKYAIYEDGNAYGIKIDMRELETRDPDGSAIPTGNDGGKYAGVFLGGNVGIGTNKPEHILEVKQTDGSAIARFGSSYSDMTIEDYQNGKIAFIMRDLADEITHNVLTLAKNKVGIGISDPDSALVVNGDVRIGALNSPSGEAEAPGQGNKLYFSGAPDVSQFNDSDNGDPLAIYRYNVESEQSELRVQISSYNADVDMDTRADDKFVVGYDKSETYYPILQVAMNGHVGIYDGQDSTVDDPAARLHVIGSTDQDAESVDDHIAIIQNTGGDGADSLAIHHVTSGPEDQVPNAGFITFRTNNTVLGAITGNEDGNGVQYLTNGADYAEYLEKENKDEAIEPGDIVGVVNGIVTKSTSGAQQAMVRSTSPGVAGNWPGDKREDEFELIAFFGQVPVKVTGKVNVGDYILPSGKNDGTGIAVKKENIPADQLHLVVGRAWEASNEEGISKIKVAVGFNFSVPSYYEEFQKVQDLRQDIKTIKATQDDQYNKLNEQLESQEAAIESLIKKINAKR